MVAFAHGAQYGSGAVDSTPLESDGVIPPEDAYALKMRIRPPGTTRRLYGRGALMAHATLWIESLIAGLLIVCTSLGTIVNASSRLWRPRLWQLLLGPLFAILAVAVPVGLTVFAGVLTLFLRMPGVPLYPMAVWASLFIMGTSVLLVGGLRIRSESRQPCAMSGRWAGLSLALRSPRADLPDAQQP